MRSHLLWGTVRHRRSRPVTYELEHAVYYFALDLGELANVTRRLRLVSRNGPNAFSFRDEDHWAPATDDLPATVETHLRSEGFDPDGWQVTLITNLRTLGYVFNPASFYLCRDRSGELRVVLVEVHNTFGERIVYTLRPQARGSGHWDGMAKEMYVSPFIGMDASYRIRVQDDPTGVRIAIAEDEGGDPVLTASLVLRRVPLTDRGLLRLLVRVPLVTHKTIAAIHLHALRLWLRGVRFHRRSPAGATQKHSEATR
jgi:DUF1365 family protein